MASLVKRCWATGFSLRRRISAGSRDFADGKMTMSTCVDSSPRSRKTSPWLMLPPVIEDGGDTVYKFYNLSEDKEESFLRNSEVEMAEHDAKFVGSSHGWLALFNRRNNNHIFLYNPITGRHIKLPPIETLPGPKIKGVSKLILSSSPDDDTDECIAIMTFGQGDRLAFCHPCRSTQWTPIGELFYSDCHESYLIDEVVYAYGRAYEDFVYWGRLKLFTCITQFEIDLFSLSLCYPTCQLEDWDLSDPHSPIQITCSGGERGDRKRFGFEGDDEWIDQNLSLLDKCRRIPYLVYAEQQDQLFIVIRFVMDRVALDGSYVHIDEIPYDPISGRLLGDTYPYKTIGFCALKVYYRPVNGKEMVDEVSLVQGGSDSLDGLTMFIGMNHSFAVSSADFPNLKPNSIYFTDANRHASSIYGGHDIGIFDYANKTLSPCYCYPCVDDVKSLKRIAPPPMWFTPSLGN
ncbi:hypothetical protein CASFOL_014765 [Castilleja foliolosa]|uniref:KIB1-4 beta-propeller domain-containing protein n=1 Tax=Castilleja foliolosa TaxID=1961234 RepID=A0ABD3DFV3_9LAMI